MLKMTSVTPKSNRMVIFSPELNHCVEPHMGDRVVFVLILGV